jgi:hypothetical protein
LRVKASLRTERNRRQQEEEDGPLENLPHRYAGRHYEARAGAANLSRNSWEYHTNLVSVFTTDIGTELDQEFKRFVDEYRDTYSDRTLLDGLVEALSFATVLSMVWMHAF